MHKLLGSVSTVALFCVLIFDGTASISAEKDHAKLYSPVAIEWKPGPLSLPKGAMVALLEGDPTKEGPFVFRIKFPDGFRIAPHWHSKPERVTVISGVLYFGMGDKFDAAAAKEMRAGTYGQWPPGMKHFGYAKGETIIQLHGVGPWTIQYVNPADDPRNEKKSS